MRYEYLQKKKQFCSCPKLYVKMLMKHEELQEKINWEMEDIKRSKNFVSTDVFIAM